MIDDNTIQSIKSDRTAQMNLYRTYYKRIYNSCYRILRDRYEAEDAMQECFIKAFANIDRYDAQTPFDAWIIRIAINTAIDRLRKNRIEFVDYNDVIISNQIDDADDEKNEQELLMEKVEQIKNAIEQLPNPAQVIVSLYLIEGYDHEEIAGILNIQPGNARIQYMRAKQKLIDIIKQNKK